MYLNTEGHIYTMNIYHDVKLIPTEKLKPYKNNPKKHPQKQIDKLKKSIKEFGFTVPLIIGEDNEIIAGHGRLLAAKQLGIEKLPCIERTDLSEEQMKAFRIADNKLTESTWDNELLNLELDELQDLDIDTSLTGFDEDEILELQEEQIEVKELDEEPIEDKDLEDLKILNLYAGIGGNRKLWGDEVNVTAVEWNEEIAKAYQDFFPEDEVVVEDAHEYLLNNFQDYDFIWSSPPCPTHSKIRKNTAVESGQADPVYPDLKLYEEIIFLQGYFKGKWVVENVQSWYNPLIEPQEVGRHYFWSNFDIPKKKIDKGELKVGGNSEKMEKYLGYDLSNYKFPSDYPKQKILNNCVHPKIGKIILEAATN